MRPTEFVRLWLLLVWLATGCSDGPVAPPPPPPPPPSPELNCAQLKTVDLDRGAATVLAVGDGSGCVRLTAEGTSSEFLIAVVSGASARTGNGILGGFEIRGRAAPAVAAAIPEASTPGAVAADPAQQFHANLRRIEAAWTPPTVNTPAVAPAAKTPRIGTQRQFNVCGSISCDGFVPVVAEARYVGQTAVLYTEVGLPSGGFDEEELRRTGELIDRYIVPLDTANFGRPSDIDHDGLVNVVLTKAVNRLTPVCLGGVIVGYFLGTDLVPGTAGSNATEVVYVGVPDPNGEAGCRVPKDFFARLLAPTIIHEIQHLIKIGRAHV